MKTWWCHVRTGRLRLHGRRPCCWLPRGSPTWYMRHGSRVYMLTAKPYRGICVTAMWDMCGRVGHLDPPTWTWEFPVMKKKSTKAASELGRHLAAMESTIFTGLLPLVEHMAVRQYDDGDPRDPGYVTIRTTGSAWQVQVKDVDACCSFTATADTLDKALETAALLLSCDEAPWEQDRWLMDAAKRRKK